ncbi:MAG: hypothetical protein QOE97_1283 [Pseudonocardiales bacterium]|jgi:hypothetical protein|nr:hypothetical protein [Pseudonocardiales bacterium]
MTEATGDDGQQDEDELRHHSESQAEGADDDDDRADVPREHSEDPAEG